MRNIIKDTVYESMRRACDSVIILETHTLHPLATPIVTFKTYTSELIVLHFRSIISREETRS